MPHMMAFMPHRDVIVEFRVKFTNIVPHKICCASPPRGQEATLSNTLIYKEHAMEILMLKCRNLYSWGAARWPAEDLTAFCSAYNASELLQNDTWW